MGLRAKLKNRNPLWLINSRLLLAVHRAQRVYDVLPQRFQRIDEETPDSGESVPPTDPLCIPFSLASQRLDSRRTCANMKTHRHWNFVEEIHLYVDFESPQYLHQLDPVVIKQLDVITLNK